MVERLLQEGVDPNIINNDGETPLMIAVAVGNGAIVNLLVQYRHTDLFLTNPDGKTAKMMAMEQANGNMGEIASILAQAEITPVLRSRHDPPRRRLASRTPSHLLGGSIFNGISKTIRAARGKRRYYEYTRREKNEMNRNKRAALKAEAAPIMNGKIRNYLSSHPDLDRLYRKNLSYNNYTPEERDQMLFVRHSQLVNNANDRARAHMTNLNTKEGNNTNYQAQIHQLQQNMNARQNALEAHREAYQKGTRKGGCRGRGHRTHGRRTRASRSRRTRASRSRRTRASCR
jgi:hypothetical protein